MFDKCNLFVFLLLRGASVAGIGSGILVGIGIAVGIGVIVGIVAIGVISIIDSIPTSDAQVEEETGADSQIGNTFLGFMVKTTVRCRGKIKVLSI